MRISMRIISVKLPIPEILFQLINLVSEKRSQKFAFYYGWPWNCRLASIIREDRSEVTFGTEIKIQNAELFLEEHSFVDPSFTPSEIQPYTPKVHEKDTKYPLSGYNWKI